MLAYSKPEHSNPVSRKQAQGSTEKAGASSKHPEGAIQIAPNLISPTFGLGTRKMPEDDEIYGASKAGAAAAGRDGGAGAAGQPERAHSTESVHSLGGG